MVSLDDVLAAGKQFLEVGLGCRSTAASPLGRPRCRGGRSRGLGSGFRSDRGLGLGLAGGLLLLLSGLLLGNNRGYIFLWIKPITHGEIGKLTGCALRLWRAGGHG